MACVPDAVAQGHDHRAENTQPLQEYAFHKLQGVLPQVNSVTSRCAAHLVDERAIRQRLGEMHARDFVRAVEIGERARHAQHAMIAARRQQTYLRFHRANVFREKRPEIVR